MKIESLAMTIDAALIDKRLRELAGKSSEEVKIFYYDIKTKEEIPAEMVLEWIGVTGRIPRFSNTGCEEADDLFTSAGLLQLHGYLEQAKKTLKHAFYLSSLHHTEGDRLERLEKTLHSAKQQAVAKKPRNKNYNEAMRIAKKTWEKYPCASKGQLCENLRKHFNNGVSVDRLDAWFTEAGIVPPRPPKYTSFCLVF
ncbi:hypothetical protein [Salmonella bongori]|uniref:hypothetical protein n=1 Tax=Salmonella bongori TaxID=54736 RepID=UPI0009AA779E|nr:hypothetical protein [Salmonella bongori]